VKCIITGSVLFTLALFGQETSTSSSTSVDINGHRVANGPQIDQTRSKDYSETTERMQSINGRMVPIERVEEHVLRDDVNGRVVERIIHQYDATGNPTAPIKETVEEQKRPDGGSTTQTTRYQGDINGSMRVIQKSITDVQKSGSTETSDTVLQRPTGNGLETVEKKNVVTVKDGNGYRAEATTYRRDGNGGFAVVVRQTTEHTEQGGQATDNTAEYEVGGDDGRLHLHTQTVANTVTQPDGSKESVVNIFGQNAPGTIDPNGKLKLYEQQLIERKPGAGGTVTETLSVRRPTVSDPNTLGPSRQISETVCKGKCGQ
jgi:hypothetical protein